MAKALMFLISLLAMIPQGYAQTSDTIPFELGENDAIYITGSINGSAPLKFMFMPNTERTILYKAGEMKGAKLIAGESGYGAGQPGKPVSGGNVMNFQAINISNASIIYDNQFPTDADGIVGNSVISGKTLELDYDKNILVLHNYSFEPGETYRSVPVRFRGTTPYVEVTVASRHESLKEWIKLDPGGVGSLSVGKRLTQENHLSEIFERFGVKKIATTGAETIEADIVKIPRVGIASLAAQNVTADIYRNGGEEPGSLGNDFLKRFNLVIDYRQNLLWMKPNHLIQVPYKLEKQRRYRDHLFLPFPQIAIFLGVFALLVFTGITLLYRKKSDA